MYTNFQKYVVKHLLNHEGENTILCILRDIPGALWLNLCGLKLNHEGIRRASLRNLKGENGIFHWGFRSGDLINQ
jgi:hypothetical protein